jgi:Amt family ammonium transporter
MGRRFVLALAMIGALMPMPAGAQVAVADSGDTAWVLGSALLILIAAVPGMALRFGGNGGRAVGTATAASLAWAIVGYSLTFGAGGPWAGGYDRLLLEGLSPLYPGMTISESAFVFFQMSLALLGCGLVVGAQGGRFDAPRALLFAPVWVLLVHAPVARAIWGGGWLSHLGTIDFAGGIVVHLSAGVSALAVMLAIRLRDGASPVEPVVPSLTGVGLGIGWIGGLAIIGGWSLGATDGTARALLDAHCAAAAAALAWGCADALRVRRLATEGMAHGALAGLAAMAATAGLAGPGTAMLVGAVAGLLCRFACALPRLLGTDDPGHVFAVHGVGGAVGALALCLLPGPTDGAAIDRWTLLAAQAAGIGTVALWAGLVSGLIALALSFVLPRAASL